MNILQRAVAQLDALKACAVENHELFAHYVLSEAQRTIIEVLSHPRSVEKSARPARAALRIVPLADIVAKHGTQASDRLTTDPVSA